jgi:hypothetical protein
VTVYFSTGGQWQTKFKQQGHLIQQNKLPLHRPYILITKGDVMAGAATGSNLMRQLFIRAGETVGKNGPKVREFSTQAFRDTGNKLKSLPADKANFSFRNSPTNLTLTSNWDKFRAFAKWDNLKLFSNQNWQALRGHLNAFQEARKNPLPPPYTG